MKTILPLGLAIARKMLIPALSVLGGGAAVAFTAEYQAFCRGLF